MATAPRGVSPSVQASTQSSSGDPLSPTTIILNRLRAQGVPITPENIRRAVTEMGRSSNQAGPDVSGDLRVAEVEDSAPRGQSRSSGRGNAPKGGPGVGQRGSGGSSVARQIENPPMVNLGGNPYGDEGPIPGLRDEKKTSAPPQATGGGSSGGLDLTDLIGPLAAGGAALGGAGLFNYLDRRGRSGGQTFMGNQPMPPTGRVMDLNPTAIPGGARPAIEGPQMALPGPASASGGVPPAATDMEAAMQRAMQPAGAPTLSSGGAPDLSGVRPFVQPADVIGAGQPLPPGISDADAARAAIGPGGMTQDRVAGQVGVPEVPLASNPAIRGQPMPEIPGRSGFFNALLDALSSAGNVASRAVRR